MTRQDIEELAKEANFISELVADGQASFYSGTHHCMQRFAALVLERAALDLHNTANPEAGDILRNMAKGLG